jgi:hypothetical protein
MKTINQIKVRPWPLKKVGDEKFFGYVVAMGVVSNDLDDTVTPYVDFAYSSSYTRYELPMDDQLLGRLRSCLMLNVKEAGSHGTLAAKVRIQLREDGYAVELP